MSAVGGEARARTIVLLALVLALSSADTSAVGAAAAPLKRALHIDFTQIGLLVALPSLAAAIATVPVGALSDRVCRVALLKWSIVAWSIAMLAAGASASFGMLLITRLVLGIVTATSGPTLASLIGDFFDTRERGKVYGFILTGDLFGSVIGLFISGNAASISWRLAFWVLVIPSAGLAWGVWRFMAEPPRGGRDQVITSGAGGGGSGPAGAQARDLSLGAAVRYVLRVRTNLALIIASSLGYFFISGVLTFGVIFVRHQYSVGQSVATSLLAVLAIAAVAGVLASGRLADALIRSGHESARVIVAAGAFLSAAGLFVLPILSRSVVLGLPLLWLAGAALYGSNPPLDAARLDVMPPWLWGRAEGVRTLLRSLTTAFAPLLFGFISDLFANQGDATHASGQSANSGGIDAAFLIMLVPLTIGGLILLRGRRTYASDTRRASSAKAIRGTPAVRTGHR